MLAYVPGGGIRLAPILSIHPRMGQAAPLPMAPPAPAAVPAAPSGGGPPMAVAGALAAGVGLASIALSAGGTWVGIHTGMKEKGFLSFTGWTVGIVSGLTGLAALAALAGGVTAAAARR